MSKRFVINASVYKLDELLSLLNNDEVLLSTVVNLIITQPDISQGDMKFEVIARNSIGLDSNQSLNWDKIYIWMKTKGPYLRHELTHLFRRDSTSIKSVVCSYAYVTEYDIYVVVLTENLNLVKRLKRKFARKGKLVL